MSGTSLLERMANASRARVAAARAEEPEGRLLERALGAPPAPPLRLGDFDVIAELKLRSPSAGDLSPVALDRARQVSAYAAGGAAAVSVLTEPDEFRGSLADLAGAAVALAPLGVPVMRKDFLTDPYQVLEARAAGAGGVLVIVTMLTDAEVGRLLAAARETGLFALLEAFDARDLERVAEIDVPRGGPPVLVGVNCRNLHTLDVDFRRFAELARHLPPQLPAVAESGVGTAADARSVAALGYRLALVGAALMRSAAPRATVAELLAAGRSAAREQAGATHVAARTERAGAGPGTGGRP